MAERLKGGITPPYLVSQTHRLLRALGFVEQLDQP